MAKTKTDAADTWTLQRFRLAGRAHLHSAHSILAGENTSASKSGPKAANAKAPALVHVSAVYLAQVALECALKARLLLRGAFASVADLEVQQPKIHASLFKSKKGHEIAELQRELDLKTLMGQEGKRLQEDACWDRICAAERAYRLRYGAEELTTKDAEADVKRASELVNVLLAGLGNLGGKRG